MVITAHNMEQKPGYKRTEIGWLPEDWKIELLGNCLLNAPEYGINAAAVQYTDSLPTYIRITDITEDGCFSPEKIASVKHISADKYILEKGDLVFARTGASVGKTYLYKPEDGVLVFAGYLIRVKVNSLKLLPDYLAAYSQTEQYWKWVKVMSMRSGQPGINGNEYAHLTIPLPPLPEQQAIAAALGDVDALIASLDALIAKKRDIKHATMQQLLTGKTRLPGFSGAWEVKKLGEISEIGRGRVISHREISASLYSTYPVYSSQTFNDGIMGYVDTYDFEGEYITWTTDGVNAGTVFYRNGYFNCTNVCGIIKVEKHNAFFISKICNGPINL